MIFSFRRPHYNTVVADHLLHTKFYLPGLRAPSLVPRPRLLEKMGAGLEGRLTLVSAPAGFGKTTLISDFGLWILESARQTEHPKPKLCWLSLDGNDDDLARFMTYLVAAMASPGDGGMLREAPLLDQDVITHYANARPPDVQTLMMILINGISAVPERVILILDDYQVISLAVIHKALAFLLEHMPPNMHLVMGTRSDPPLALARLRGRGQVTEIRQRDLQFSAPEAAQFLQQTAGVHLTAAEAAALVERTEGWPAGLQMAAISLCASDDVAAFIHDFTGSNRHVLDYLLGEVLDNQPAEIQRFLLHTAILDRLNAPLCAALLESAEAANMPPGTPAQQMLELLERSNLFVTPLDQERGWYRYHRLFADLLRFTLRKKMPEKIPLLQRRASGWFEDNGFVVEAIDYAAAAGDFQRAARLLEEHAQHFLKRGEIALLLRRLDALPEHVIVERPSLCIYHAGTRLLAGRPLAEVEGRLADAGEEGAVSAVALVFKSLIALLLGDVGRSLDLSGQAQDSLAASRVEDSAYWRSTVFSSRGMAFVMTGDVEAAINAFEASARIGREAGNKMAVVGSLANLAGLTLARGQLHQAATSYRRALDLATDAQGNKLPLAHHVLLGLGELAREWNNLAEAQGYFQESLALSLRFGEMGRLMSLLHLARVKGAQGEREAAGDLFEEARQLALRSEATSLDDVLVEMSQARCALEQGDLAAAERWARSVQHPAPGAQRRVPAVPYEVRDVQQLLLARLVLARGQAEKALAILDPLLQAAGQRGQNRRLIEILGLKALAQEALGDEDAALATIGQALALAEPEEYVRMFVDAGEGMARLLAVAVARGIAVDYGRRLLEAFPGRGAGDGTLTTQPLLEPLSERELEVLQLIAEGLSNREIAARLVISLSTVKGHTANIYGKLGVHRRTLAVAKARELELLA